MTAPDRSVKIEPNPFAGGSRPHMNFVPKSQDRLTDNGAVRIRVPTAGSVALRNWRDAAQFPESKDKLPLQSQPRHGAG